VSLVLDASFALSWYFEDERTPVADTLLDRVVDQGATVPGLWRLEIANGLRTAIRRNRIDQGFRDRAIAQPARLPITVTPTPTATPGRPPSSWQTGSR
jgi:predicted nucleic acid-binding protein